MPGPQRRAAASELEFLQVRVRGESSRLVARVDELFADDDVELARLARPNVNRPAPASFDPRLHTEGFGLVASDGAVMYDDSHGRYLAGGRRARTLAGSLPAANGKCQFSIRQSRIRFFRGDTGRDGAVAGDPQCGAGRRQGLLRRIVGSVAAIAARSGHTHLFSKADARSVIGADMDVRLRLAAIPDPVKSENSWLLRVSLS